MRIEKGVTRIVFVFNRFVLKIPNFEKCHMHFLNGCYANWSERYFCKVWRDCKEPDLYKLVAPTYFCSWFGLIQIQARVEILGRQLTKKEEKIYNVVSGGDLKRVNFGWYKDRLVCCDYV